MHTRHKNPCMRGSKVHAKAGNCMHARQERAGMQDRRVHACKTGTCRHARQKSACMQGRSVHASKVGNCMHARCLTVLEHALCRVSGKRQHLHCSSSMLWCYDELLA